MEDYIRQILLWIGFTIEEQRNSIYDDSINSFSDIRIFTEKYISNLSTDFSGRTQANGKIRFRLSRTKWMKALLRWVQDFHRISGNLTIVEINEVMFIEQLDTTLYKENIRKNLIDQSNTKATEDSPGPLES